MFSFILPLISIIIASFIGINAANAWFVPGASIAMTGANSEVQFDVADDLLSSIAVWPSLITTSSTFTGAFYASGIGWIEFHTGSYTVWLNCAEPLSGLKVNCPLTNTGWSENIWEIGFAGTEYNPTTGLLEWKISSNMWDIDLTGIILPLKPVEINESTLVANHNSTISVKNVEWHESTLLPWDISITPMWTTQSQTQTDIHGVFSVDISIASSYEIIITDPNRSTTTSTINVSNNVPTTTLIASSHFLDDFCTKISLPDHRCPDGATKIATTLTQLPPSGSIFANGTDTYTITHKIRDGYGNRVSSGDLKLRYTTTVKNAQIPDHISYDDPGNIDGNAFISTELGTGLGGTIDKPLNIWVSDLTYNIASTAPTNSDNKISLDSVIYVSGSVDAPLLFTPPDFRFDPIYTASVSSSDPIAWEPHPFHTDITKNDISTTITPTVVSTLKIGGTWDDKWRTLSSNPTEICTNYPLTPSTIDFCNWSNWDISIIATESSTSFGFTGTYTSLNIGFPFENTHIDNYVYYKIGGDDIFYKSTTATIGTATAPSERVKILGTTSNWLGGTEARVRLIDSIRKQSKLLSRNREKYHPPTHTDVYNDIDTLIVENQDFNISDNDIFAGGGIHGKAKRAIIVIGWDIIIENNIDLWTHPIALIALSNMSNQWGNIRIKWTVTDIHSTLVSERALLSDTSNSQLYIHGTVVSANPPREIAPSSCPYFAPVGCVKSDYDLPNMRSTFVSPTNSSIGWSTYTAPIVIESDSRLINNSPSILKQ
jgi:hypothetical protein